MKNAQFEYFHTSVYNCFEKSVPYTPSGDTNLTRTSLGFGAKSKPIPLGLFS